MPLLINGEAEKVIKDSEGLSLNPYLCPALIATIGWGSIWRVDGTRVRIDDGRITKREAESLFVKEANHVGARVFSMIKVPINVNQFSALVCLAYNIGSGRFRGSTLRMKLNRGDYEGAANEFWKWRRANGVILRGLVIRRKLEEIIFLTPV